MPSEEMDILGLRSEQARRIAREREMHRRFKSGELRGVVVSSSDADADRGVLLAAAHLFQRQLSKMPKEYVLRQVFDTKHATMALVGPAAEVVGGVCYRPFFERGFVEIVFLAVDYDFQVLGVGGFMMDLFKEVAKGEMRGKEWEAADSVLGIYRHKCVAIDDLDALHVSVAAEMPGPLYLVTYADNFAIGYFKKQGFSTDIRFGGWEGVIKDYEGGTIVECKVLWEIDYLRKQEAIEEMRREVLQRMRAAGSIHVLYKIDDYSGIKGAADIPGVPGEAGTGREVAGDAGLLDRFISYLISDLQSNAHAWPFLKPIDPEEVPDYYRVIANPMDLSTMLSKLESNKYKGLEPFVRDVRLMASNCMEYNGKDTQYYKCAQMLLDHFHGRLESYRHVASRLWAEGPG